MGHIDIFDSVDISNDVICMMNDGCRSGFLGATSCAYMLAQE